MRAKEKAKKENKCDKCTHEHCNPCYDFEHFKPKNKTIADWYTVEVTKPTGEPVEIKINGTPVKTLVCHNWNKTVALSYCLEKCTSHSCQDTDEIVKLQT